jgi:uncharacterized protein GlcG (DUF336 family)
MLKLSDALASINSGISKAQDMDLSVCISIFDAAGNEVATVKMDGAFAVSPTFARAKAVTSATLGMQTDQIAQYSGEGKPYYGVENLEGGRFSTIAGGVPIMLNGKLAGGVGVGGSTDTNQDLEIAKYVAGQFQS